MRALPAEADRLCGDLRAPRRLVLHLQLVHHVARELVASMDGQVPGAIIDPEVVGLGAATHDLGKVIHPEELANPGSLHEEAGRILLEKHGVPPHLARFAPTHGQWHGNSPLEDLLVALADHTAVGKHSDGLERLVVARLTGLSGTRAWRLSAWLDDVVTAERERCADRYSM